MLQSVCILLCCVPQTDLENYVGVWKSDADELLRLRRDGKSIIGSLTARNAHPIAITGRIRDGQFIFEYTHNVATDGNRTVGSGSGFLKLSSGRHRRLIGGYGPVKDSHRVEDVEARGDWRYVEVDLCLSREELTSQLASLVNEELDCLADIVDLTDNERSAAHGAVRKLISQTATEMASENSVGIWRIPAALKRALTQSYDSVLTRDHLAEYNADRRLRDEVLHRTFVAVTLTGLDMGLALDRKQFDQIHDWLSSPQMSTSRLSKNASGLLMSSQLPQERLKELLTESQLQAYRNRRTTFRNDAYVWPKHKDTEAMAGLEEDIDKAIELRIQAWRREYTVDEDALSRIRVLRNRVAKRLAAQRLLANEQLGVANGRGGWLAQSSPFFMLPRLNAGVLISSDAIWRKFRVGIIDRTERDRYTADLTRRTKLEHEAEILRLALRIDNGGRHVLTGRQLRDVIALLEKSLKPNPLRKLSHLDPDLTISRVPKEELVSIIGDKRWANRQFTIQNTVRIAKMLNYEGALELGTGDKQE